MRWLLVIHRFQTLFFKRCAHPPGWTRAEGRHLFVMPETIQLRAGFNTHAHQLRFIHDPKAIVVEQTKVHRPAVAAHAVAAIEGATEKHVLRTDEDGVFLGINVPFAGVLSAHKDVDANFACSVCGVTIP
ncbi:MAG TPA: hypothetical protein PKO21_15460 [Verrucomicrobiota bacterium]|nr:hypothetical protein [Verrucomicrobiota bacterium]